MPTARMAQIYADVADLRPHPLFLVLVAPHPLRRCATIDWI